MNMRLDLNVYNIIDRRIFDKCLMILNAPCKEADGSYESVNNTEMGERPRVATMKVTTPR